MRPDRRLAFIDCSRAAAAAEMALVTPIFVILMFGSFELGNYFLSEHVVVKAVRDGARYAARQPIAAFSCPSTVDGTVSIQTRNITRTGDITSDGSVSTASPRLIGWNDASGGQPTVAVTLNCTTITGGNYAGIYSGRTAVPTVKVRATVDYKSLFNRLGIKTLNLKLNAESEAAVMAI